VIALVLAFIVAPLVELAVIIKVGGAIGVLNTLALLILLSVVGGWLVKWQGIAVLRRVQASLTAGQMPGNELIDGLLVLVAGALLLAPGFVSDALGLALLFPPVRAVVRRILVRRFRARVVPLGGPGPQPGAGYIDLT
jgi:UPF0716 protein FxsA